MRSDLNTNLPEQLAAFRKANGLTMADAAIAARCSVGSWHAWESGTSLPSSMAMPSLAAALDLLLDDLRALVESVRQARLTIARQVLADAEAQAANAPATPRQHSSTDEAAVGV